jgi:hypothetical protein
MVELYAKGGINMKQFADLVSCCLTLMHRDTAVLCASDMSCVWCLLDATTHRTKQTTTVAFSPQANYTD